ncbi:MAG: MFS transporter [Lachnospiraceae bacterium]|nr:MFS transporter [Lachnospiraceae bacterium]
MFQLLLIVIYLAFISLGLPDSLLGSAWPTMYQELGAELSYAGILSATISAGTIISALLSDRLTRRLGAGKITAISVGMTAAALWGFSASHSFLALWLWAIPYGLGAGSVDAALNNYVALHYESRHMSWLHCMWGVGAATGPVIMGHILTAGGTWNTGYRTISILQIGLTAILIFSLPLWKKPENQEAATGEGAKALSLPQILRIPGAPQILFAFFCYCALEGTAGLWAASFLVRVHGVDASVAASYASMFYIGITVGRFLSGFITMKLNDPQMIRLGYAIQAIGILMVLLPLGKLTAIIGLIVIGLGCAPVYPCIIHSTPTLFGADRSQALIGVQMASAYIGTLCAPPLFGLLANAISVRLYPWFMAVILALGATAYLTLLRIIEKERDDI